MRFLMVINGNYDVIFNEQRLPWRSHASNAALHFLTYLLRGRCY